MRFFENLKNERTIYKYFKQISVLYIINDRSIDRNDPFQQDIFNEHQLYTARLEGIRVSAGGTRESTRNAYNPKIKEFQDWCEQKKFADGAIVSENKLLLYLQEIIIPRGNTKKNAVEKTVPLSYNGLDGYVKAIISLYNHQNSMKG